ncbi:MAG: 3'(2'),5'-bisphosphate nucleotidase [Acidobacteria bacterium]|nr:3'(2'),5'-bisphosphate nucleotidase [Acidobacteriota bacterium]
MIDLAHPEVGFAVGVVRETALLAKEVQRKTSITALTKEDQSPVTVADFAVQALLGRSLEKAFPHDPLVAEEDSGLLRSAEGQTLLERVTESLIRVVPGATPEKLRNWIDRGGNTPTDRFWALDPIDGTKGFLRGAQYAVALALVVKGRVQIGVLGCPNLEGGFLIAAVRGKGCWRTSLAQLDRFEKLQVSECKEATQARVLRSFESDHTNITQMDELLRALGVKAKPQLMDSQAKYALLAEGKGDLLFRLLSPKHPDYREKIWDQAAGSLVVEEAGGRVTDLDGKGLNFSVGRTLTQNRGVVASNGHLHEVALQVLATGANKKKSLHDLSLNQAP